MSGDGDYGPPSDLPWAMAFPEGTVPTISRVHPTMMYESLSFAIAFLILWSLRKKNLPTGWLALLYLILAGIIRFAMEFWRNTDQVLGFLTAAQLVSIGLVILGGVLLALLLIMKPIAKTEIE